MNAKSNFTRALVPFVSETDLIHENARGCARQRMNNSSSLGKVFFFCAIAFFGIELLAYASQVVHPLLGPPWIPVGRLSAGITGLVLLTACTLAATKRHTAWVGVLLAVVFLLRAMLVYLPMLARNLRAGGIWTSFFELVAVCGASLFLVSGSNWPPPYVQARTVRRATSAGPFLFALSLAVFGIQHFIYGPYLATLVPSWIPGRLFWAYFVGTAFEASALALFLRRNTRLATTLLGIMYFSWVLIVHAPRVAAALQNGNEWTSGFVALAMSGAALILTELKPRERSPSVLEMPSA
jgi:hypothetical protein